MEITKKISLKAHSWLQAPPLVKLLNILNKEGINARMVGGCVRDMLLGCKIIDIDIACSLPPEESQKRLENAGVKVVPTGLKHGTITAVINKRSFEITTLRRDEQTDGRHAKVAYTDDWLEDARRRDFTINALYLDADGGLYDPCGGLADIAARRVRFIGEADERIQEDALRILRFFRFSAQIGQNHMDPSGREACIKNRKLIEGLSGERLAQELLKILQTVNLLPIIKVMCEEGILEKIIPNHESLGHEFLGHEFLQDLTGYVGLERSLGKSNILARLSCLLPKTSDGITSIKSHLKLSNKQAKTLKNYTNHSLKISAAMTQKDIRRAIYHSDRDIFIVALLQSWASNKLDKDHENYRKILAYAENWPIAIFPVQGKNLMTSGLKSGPEIGRILHELEQEWVQSDFHLTREELLARVI